jgi:hypothetical protein
MKQIELNWIAQGQDRAYAEYNFTPGDGDTTINLQTVFSDVAAQGVKPAAMELYINQAALSITTSSYVLFNIDGVNYPIYGRYRLKIRPDQKTLIIYDQGSNQCTLKFYSWDVFGATFADNAVVVNGSVAIIDQGYAQVDNSIAFMIGNKVGALAAGQSGVLALKINNSVPPKKLYLKKLTISTDLAGEFILGLSSVGTAYGTVGTTMAAQNKNLLSAIMSNSVMSSAAFAGYFAPNLAVLDYISIQAHDTKILEFKEPILMRPNGAFLTLSLSSTIVTTPYPKQSMFAEFVESI